MAEGTEPIRQDIDEIRGNMTETLEQIEARVRGTVDSTVDNVRQVFDLRRQVSDHPWAAIGVALAAGYVLGNMGGDDQPHIPPPRPGQPMRYYPEHGYRPDSGASYGSQGYTGQSYGGQSSSSSSQGFAHTPSYGGQSHTGQSHTGQSHTGQSYGSQSHTSQGFSGQGFSGQGGQQQGGIGSQMGGMVSRMAQPFSEELSVMATAALHSLMRALRESLQSSIPQFDTEYQRARSQRASSSALERSRMDVPSYGAEREVGGSTYSSGMGSGSMGGSSGSMGGSSGSSGSTGSSGSSGSSGSTGSSGTSGSSDVSRLGRSDL